MAAAATALASASAAGATVYTPPDGPALQAAITNANANPGPDTIILAENNGISYQPTAAMTITDTLTITGDHANQGPFGGPTIDGGAVLPLQSDLFTVNPGVTASFVGFTITTASDIGFAVIRAKGTAKLDNVALSGNNGTQLVVNNGGSATVTNSSVNDGNAGGISSSTATLILNNSTVANNASGGVAAQGGTFQLNNTIVAKNNPLNNGSKDCFAKPTSTTTSLDSDSSCGVGALSGKDPLLGASLPNGGPTPSLMPAAGSPAINAGTNAICPTTDQRFFVRNDGSCDIGAMERSGVRDTTAPACAVSGLRAGPPKQQDVTASDSGSGLGPDAISAVTISNGSVALSPFSSPSTGPLVVTATKTDQALVTQWSFTATDWAGNVKDCR
jgi:hypothetical protein